MRKGKTLSIKFTEATEKKLPHSHALAYCRSQGLRLPTIRELFDFCASGVTGPNYGPFFEKGKYPASERCGGGELWSASIVHNWGHPGRFAWANAWIWNNLDGSLKSGSRRLSPWDERFAVRCVGVE